MTTLSMEDRYIVLERKLREAESAIFGCRAMLNYCRRLERDVPDDRITCEVGGDNPARRGLYPGQLDNYIDPSEEADSSDPSQECVE